MGGNRDRTPPPGRRTPRPGPARPRRPHQPPRVLRRDDAAPGSYHHGERARELLRLGLERHGCATTRQLATRLGVPHGPRLLIAIGYRGDAPAAWRELAPELAGEPDRPDPPPAAREAPSS